MLTLHLLWKLATALLFISCLEILYFCMVPLSAISVTPILAVKEERSELSSLDLDKAVKVILDRPLFEPSRRPKTDRVETVSPSEKPIPRLAGIVVTGARRIAIFECDCGTSKMSVDVGEPIGSYIIHEIGLDNVTLVRDGNKIRVNITFRSKSPETAVSAELDVEKFITEELGL